MLDEGYEVKVLDLFMYGEHVLNGVKDNPGLEQIKGDGRLRPIPVAVLSSSDRDEDVAKSYGLGGNHFITKPEDVRDL